MPGRPDMPCSHCGKLMWRGKGVLPEGQARCMPCRRLSTPSRVAPEPIPCAVCGAPFVAKDSRGRYCGAPCRRVFTIEALRRKRVRAMPSLRTCIVCSKSFESTGCRRRCTVCRTKDLVARARCPQCGTAFFAHRGQEYCSPSCGSRADASRARPCIDCGTSTTKKPQAQLGGVVCDPCLQIRRRARWRRKNAIRQGAVVVGRQMSIQELGTRDGWRCHLCCKAVHQRFAAPDPRSPTFDHLIPVSAGGTDAPENLRLAHWGCNSSRGARGAVQLLLFG